MPGYRMVVDLTGQDYGLLRRVSGSDQVDDWRYLDQAERMQARLEDFGANVEIYDENIDGKGMSGRDLSKRKTALELLDDLKAGRKRGIGVMDISRLTREEYGFDAAEFFEAVAKRRGLIITRDAIYDPRDPRDLQELRELAAKATAEVHRIRGLFWDGLFAKAAREPFFQSRAPFGYVGLEVVEPDRRRTRKTKRLYSRPAKEPAHAEAMASLAELLDACRTKGEVIARWNADYGALYTSVASKQPRHKYGNGMSVSHLTEMLKGSQSGIYQGVFEFGRRAFGAKEQARRKKKDRTESPIWDVDDRLARRAEEFVHVVDGTTPCPCGRDHSAYGDLSYWTPVRVAAWNAKFDRGPRARYGAHAHLFRGMLECVHCFQTLVGCGKEGYTCPQRQTRGCQGQVLSENAVWRVLDPLLPQVIEQLRGYAVRALAEDAAGKEPPEVAELRRRVEACEAWLGRWARRWDDPEGDDPIPANARADRRAKEAERTELAAALEAARARAQQTVRRGEVYRLVAEEPVEALLRLDPKERALLWEQLLCRVRIRGQGSGSGRTWVLESYEWVGEGAPAGAEISGITASSVLAYLATALQKAA